MSGHKNLPKLAQIAWAADEGALTWILLEKLQKKENFVVLFRKQDPKEDRHVKLELGNLCSKIPLCVVVIQIQIIVPRLNAASFRHFWQVPFSWPVVVRSQPGALHGIHVHQYLMHIPHSILVLQHQYSATFFVRGLEGKISVVIIFTKTL
ncbi:hypothetical protein B0H10DRAFT_1960714 [Mycena sp. CBHHK59/15]|nr:hypothetical protein B0H10DRAFT_1960714 [Mycena sp. CBHHK59/15]